LGQREAQPPSLAQPEAFIQVNECCANHLMRGNPERFQLVPNQDFIKGRDY
jgi:hypothetical protein